MFEIISNFFALFEFCDGDTLRHATLFHVRDLLLLNFVHLVKLFNKVGQVPQFLVLMV